MVAPPPSDPWGPDIGDLPSVHLLLGTGRGVSPSQTFQKLPAPWFLLEPGWGSPAGMGDGHKEP